MVYQSRLQVFISASMEATNGGMVESLLLNTLRTAELDLNNDHVLPPNHGVHLSRNAYAKNE